MPSMPGGDDKKEDDKAPETPEAKAEVIVSFSIFDRELSLLHIY